MKWLPQILSITTDKADLWSPREVNKWSASYHCPESFPRGSLESQSKKGQSELAVSMDMGESLDAKKPNISILIWALKWREKTFSKSLGDLCGGSIFISRHYLHTDLRCAKWNCSLGKKHQGSEIYQLILVVHAVPGIVHVSFLPPFRIDRSHCILAEEWELEKEMWTLISAWMTRWLWAKELSSKSDEQSLISEST